MPVRRTTTSIVALQVETADCIKNIDEIAAVPGVDMLFLGQNDLCMSMGLYEKYKFPDMYTSPELGGRDQRLIAAAEEAQHHSRRVSLRHVPRRRVRREGIPLHQRRQRPASHPDAGRRVREGRRGHRAREWQGLGAASDGPHLGALRCRATGLAEGIGLGSKTFTQAQLLCRSP